MTESTKLNNSTPNNDTALSRSIKFKDKGNTAFSKNQYVQAMNDYLQGLEELVNELNITEILQTKAVLNLNISMCHYKQNHLQDSLKFADKAINCNPEYIKALYRKAVVLKDLKNYGESVQLLKTILLKDPNNKEVQTCLTSLREQLISENVENKDPLVLLKKELETSEHKDLKAQGKIFCNLTN